MVGPQRLSALRLLIAPWLLVVGFGAFWLAVLLPRAAGGQPALICLTFLAGLGLVCFLVAAVTFSRDVLTGRWPESPIPHDHSDRSVVSRRRSGAI
jgi:hypothetical protein